MAKSAVVIGGSISGLMFGTLLIRNGYSVTILEKDVATERINHAAGLSLGPNVESFLQKYDRTGRVVAIPSEKTWFVNRELKQTRKLPLKFKFTGWGLLVDILRANFDGKTSRLITEPPERQKEDGEAVFRAGCTVTSVEDHESEVLVHYTDATGSAATLTAGLVVAADGSTSKIRQILLPEVTRTYSGYVSWRGTVPENEISEATLNLFRQCWTGHFMNKNYILVYTIPSDNGNDQSGSRLLNWVWYWNEEEGSQELAETLTDRNGQKHQGTVPKGSVDPKVWERQKNIAAKIMPGPFAELLQKTENPFVTIITEVIAPKAVDFNGKLIIVGDALIGMRPHIAGATNNAATQALLFEQVLKGDLKTEQWGRQVLREGRRTWLMSAVAGVFAQGSKLAFLWMLCKYIGLFVGQKLHLIN